MARIWRDVMNFKDLVVLHGWQAGGQKFNGINGEREREMFDLVINGKGYSR